MMMSDTLLQSHNGVSGSVVSKQSSNSVGGVIIYVEDSGTFQTLADPQGHFHMYLAPGKYTLKTFSPEFPQQKMVRFKVQVFMCKACFCLCETPGENGSMQCLL